MTAPSQRPRIALCGPIAAQGRPARGGYESANLRTLLRMQADGWAMESLPYPEVSGGKAALAIGYTIGFLGLVWRIITARPRFDLVHFTPHFRPFIYVETLIAAAVRLRGGALGLDVRAGSVPYFYNRGFPLYKALFKLLLRSSQMVTCEGARDRAWLEGLGARAPWRLPNWIDAPPPLPAPDPRDALPLTLAYCGRLVPEKGLETFIEVVRLLQAEGLSVRAVVIGGGAEDYVGGLKSAAESLPIQWTGPLPPIEVSAHLALAHVFLFATTFYGEGQSNALTEAMAAGLAPCVSDHGFSADVVGPCGPVLPPTSPPEHYAAAIAALWRDGQWPELSRAAHARIVEEFSGDAVAARLTAAYRAAIDSVRRKS